MSDPQVATVAIVGGGAAGALTAVHVLRRPAPCRVVLIERRELLARGVAYSTAFSDHLLNVVAANMGDLDDQPDHFRGWLAEHRDPARPTSFLPRATYGHYLADLLDESAAAAPGRFERVRGEAVAVVPAAGGHAVELADGGRIGASAIVLATGILPARDVPLEHGAWPPAGPRYVPDPWAPGALEGIAPGNRLLLVGTGLTMVDIALRLIDLRPDAQLTALRARGCCPSPTAGPANATRSSTCRRPRARRCASTPGCSTPRSPARTRRAGTGGTRSMRSARTPSRSGRT
jgi:uncharacterized NAD(P)/FAD-binding protein YdhS